MIVHSTEPSAANINSMPNLPAVAWFADTEPMKAVRETLKNKPIKNNNSMPITSTGLIEFNTCNGLVFEIKGSELVVVRLDTNSLGTSDGTMLLTGSIGVAE